MSFCILCWTYSPASTRFRWQQELTFKLFIPCTTTINYIGLSVGLSNLARHLWVWICCFSWGNHGWIVACSMGWREGSKLCPCCERITWCFTPWMGTHKWFWLLLIWCNICTLLKRFPTTCTKLIHIQCCSWPWDNDISLFGTIAEMISPSVSAVLSIG